MVEPTLMKGRKAAQVPLHSVMDILHDIHAQGHGPAFMAAAEKAGAVVSVSPKTVNFVKGYLADNKLHENSAVAADVVNACPPGQSPYDCPYNG